MELYERFVDILTLFDKTRTWQIIKSVTKIKFVTIYVTRFFRKEPYFSRKKQKIIFGAQVPFEGKRLPGNKNEYNIFYGK